ncbi:serine/threonine-protein kinase [Promineifilum sp.]|uniref:serine/threonine-protein kinase n=1 Tax=Promineifilum sp. TaxID=2664178 RepID=UPI0035B28C28
MLAIGTVLQERYQIARFLGQGGMGVVYEAIDTRLGRRPVAVKEMDATLVAPAERQATVAAFQQEARILARLKHPGIAGVIDYFTQGDFSYFVMEYVEGETLEEALLRAPRGFQEAQALAWAGQLAVVLDYLHRQTPPIIFRDLKPGNIMVQPDGALKLIDFGIARLFKAGQTHDTIRLGTPGYAPPEQYGHGQTDARSDVYSLGVVVHQLLTGHNPAGAPMRLPPVRQFRPDLSPQTEAAVAQALQLDPALRYTSTLAFARALGAPVSGPFAAGQGGAPGQGVGGGREPIPAAFASVTGARGWEREHAASSSPGWLKPLIAVLGLLALLLVAWLLLRPLLDGDGAAPAAGAGTPAAPIVTQVVTSSAEEGAAVAEASAAAATPTMLPEKTPVNQSAVAPPSDTPVVQAIVEVATSAAVQPAVTVVVVVATPTPAAPANAPIETDLMVEDFEYGDDATLTRAYTVNAPGNELTLSLSAAQAMSGAHAASLRYRINQARDDYAGIEKNMDAPMDWRNATSICLWLANDDYTGHLVIQFREQNGEVWKHEMPLRNKTAGDFCVPLSEEAFRIAEFSEVKNGVMDLAAVENIAFYVGGSGIDEGVLYLDAVRLTRAPSMAAPLPTALPTPCQYQVLAALRGAWSDELGCPLNAGQNSINTGYAPFERGQMLWREDNDAIYVLYNNNTFARFADVWREGDPDFSCGEPNSPPTPVRGFGRIWCDNQAVRDGLGALTAYEIGDSASSSQDYANGSILIAPDGRAFIFLGHTSGTWR